MPGKFYRCFPGMLVGTKDLVQDLLEKEHGKGTAGEPVCYVLPRCVMPCYVNAALVIARIAVCSIAVLSVAVLLDESR